MDIRFRFPLVEAIATEDAWPLEVEGVTADFERTEGKVVAVVVILHDQLVTAAPSMRRLDGGPIQLELTVQGTAEARALQVVKRFLSYINLYYSVEIDPRRFEQEYLPTSDEERQAIKVFSLKTVPERRPQVVPFEMLAKAFFVSEDRSDPSFVAHMARLAREAFVDGQFIDAFRFSFLLFEALYGGGQFRSAQLVSEMASSEEFTSLVEANIRMFRSDRRHRASRAGGLVSAYPDVPSIVQHLVDRRGFYFHGNLRRRDAWHPDQHADAEGLADFCVGLVTGVAHVFGQPMFGEDVGERHFANAKKQGAVLTISVQFRYVDASGDVKTGQFEMNIPGNTPTNKMALFAHKEFLKWVEETLIDAPLIAAIARDKRTGREVFRSQYLGPENLPTSSGK